MDNHRTEKLEQAIRRIVTERDYLYSLHQSRCPTCQKPLALGYNETLASPNWRCSCGVHGCLTTLPLAVPPYRRMTLIVDCGDADTLMRDVQALEMLSVADTMVGAGHPMAATASRVLWQYQHAAELVSRRKPPAVEPEAVLQTPRLHDRDGVPLGPIPGPSQDVTSFFEAAERIIMGPEADSIAIEEDIAMQEWEFGRQADANGRGAPA